VVELIQTETFVVDVKAKSEEEAINLASEKFADIKEKGMEHYNQVGDLMIDVGTVYDVTNTDDPFDE